MPSAVSEPMLLQGTLDLLVLRTLAWGPRHGYAVARWIRETSADVKNIKPRWPEHRELCGVAREIG